MLVSLSSVSCTPSSATKIPFAFSLPSRATVLALLASNLKAAARTMLIFQIVASQWTRGTTAPSGLLVHFQAMLPWPVSKCSPGLATSALFVLRVYELDWRLFLSSFHSASDLASLTAPTSVCAVGAPTLSSVAFPSFLSTLATQLST